MASGALGGLAYCGRELGHARHVRCASGFGEFVASAGILGVADEAKTGLLGHLVIGEGVSDEHHIHGRDGCDAQCLVDAGSVRFHQVWTARSAADHRLDEWAEVVVAQVGVAVFTSTVGTMVEPRNLSRAFESLVAQSGVRRIRFHDLRHTCASLLLAQGVPARVVMDILGHSQIAVTMDLYSHVMPTALREAADAIARALGTE